MNGRGRPETNRRIKVVDAEPGRAAVRIRDARFHTDPVSGFEVLHLEADFHHRTGRFVTQPGLDSEHHDVVWVDYDAAVAMHRVINKVRAERRPERLASPSPLDNRISFGCINVPIPFFDSIVSPMFVMVAPGQMALQRMPRLAYIQAVLRVRPTRACFEAV